MEKYGRVRDDFEEKMIKATRTFQARDCTYLQQMRAFLGSFAIALDDSTVAASQVQNLFKIFVGYNCSL